MHRGLKRPVAVAQEHRDIVGVGVGDGQVEMAVAVKSPATIDEGFAPTRIDDGRAKRAVAVALQDINHAVARVGHGQVEVAGAEVARHDGCRRGPPGARWEAGPGNSPRPDWTGW